MRRAAKRDTNQAEIVEALEAHGWTVADLAGVGDGISDLLITKHKSMRFGKFGYSHWKTQLVEVKGPNGTLTPAQKRFREKWPVPIPILRSVADVEKL